MGDAFGRMSVVARVGADGELDTRQGEAVPSGGGGAAFTPAAQKYETEASIGRGGMGEVILVSDRDLMNRERQRRGLPPR